MADDNQRVRFMANNLASLNLNSFTFSTETTGFEATNAFNSFRSSTWRMSGFFRVQTASPANNKIYINDGSDKTGTIPTADHSTAASLATAIQTELNSISSGWTVSFDLAGGSYKFTLSNSGSVTLKLSTSTDSIWNTIGFTGTTDLTGTSFPAQEQRAHDPIRGEFITLDFGGLLPITFAGLVSDVSQSFGLSSTATVTLEGNNILDFNAPPLSKTLTVNDQGIFEFNVTDPQATYRFWRLRFVDTYNSVQGPNLEMGNIYLGDFQTLTGSNIQAGFIDTIVDPSLRSETEGGVLFFDKRVKFSRFSNLAIRYMLDTDKQIIKDVFNTVGTTEPFYVALDPLSKINNDITEFTKFVIFDSEPQFTSVGSCYFNTVLNLREVV